MSKMAKMEEGELQMRKAFEETTTKNVKMIRDYSTETRNLVRNLEQTVQELKNMIVQRDKETTELRQQVGLLQGKLYAGGTQ